MILISLLPLPAIFRRVERAQSKSVLYSSETAAAAFASAPVMVPGLGAVCGMVKTRVSGVGGALVEGFEGVIVEFLGKRM